MCVNRDNELVFAQLHTLAGTVILAEQDSKANTKKKNM